MGFELALESVASGEDAIHEMFGESDGRRIRDRRRDPAYLRSLTEAAKLINRVSAGTLPFHYMKEAMTTSDFPLLFADILDRQMVGEYQETVPTWPNYIRRGTVPTFQFVSRMAVDGAEGRLDRVAEREEYPEGELEVAEDRYRVFKYGKRLDLSWEAQVNDDLDAFRNLPSRLARGARRTENYIATSLWVDENGPSADLYEDGLNVIPGNPELSIEALQEAFSLLSTYTDEDGEPILIEMAELTVPPALMVPAQNILNAIQLELGDSTDASRARLVTSNWMKNRVRLNVEPYIPHIATGPTGQTMWALHANPNSGRAFAEVGFLRGHETPALYERAPNARRVGGGEVRESFEDDSMAWRVRHVLGGGLLKNTGGQKATVASDGSGTS